MSDTSLASGLAVQASLKSPNATFTITVTGTGSSRTLTISTGVSGYFLYRIWITDAAAPGDPSLTVPDGDDTTEWWEVTDSSGNITKTINYSGHYTWYPQACLIGTIGTGDAMAF